MEFKGVGIVFVREKDVEVEVEGNFYKLSKSDCREILKTRQGYKTVKEALNGAVVNVVITRGSKMAALFNRVMNDDSLYEYIVAPTRYVKFIHSSMMDAPVEEEFILLGGEWRTIDSNSPFAKNKFNENEIYSPIYWT